MKLPHIGFRVGAFLALLLSVVVHGATPFRPNIVYILADDMGIGDVSALNPACRWQTPHIDRLAREGRIFTDAHSASGVCSPSRYSLLTGRYSWRGSLKSSVLNGYSKPLIEPGRITVADFLRSHGYATAMVGKWHLGVEWARPTDAPAEVDFSQPFSGGPIAHGFEQFDGISASLDMPPYVHMTQDRVTAIPTHRVPDSPKPKMWRAGPVAPDFRHEDVQPRFFEKATRFIETRSRATDGRPFFLYLALASPHTPIVPTTSYQGRTRTNPYGDFVVELDDHIGRLLAVLDQSGLSTNTLVLFTADNGFSPAANLPELRALGHDPSAGFRGHKADLFEGGHRVPFIARWPGVVPEGTRCDVTIGQLDLLATCADLLGERLPPNAGEDSVSFLRQLVGANHPTRGRSGLVHHSNNGSFAFRQDRWKLLTVPDSGGWSFPHPGTLETNGLPRLQLYDLQSDPGEQTNRIAGNPAIARRLLRDLRSLIDRGRSTIGPVQPFDTTTPWPQRDALTEISD